jgi:Peptidase family S41
MATQMQAQHKDLYHSISSQRFAAMVAALDQKIPGLTRSQVIVAMAQIVAAVGDGHTNIYPTRDPKVGFHTLPVEFTYFGDQLYIRAVSADERSLLGARVLHIGNLSIQDAYAAAKTMIGRENEGGARYWTEYLLAMPEVLEALHITSSVEDVPLTLETSHGVIAVTLHPSFPVEMMSGDISTLFYRRPGWVDVRDLQSGPDPLWLRDIDKPFHFVLDGKLLYVQINQVNDGPDETLAHFAQRLHDEIASVKPDKVVIDLRQNRGGNGTLIVPLIRSIIQSESIDQRGRLFCIIGPATFSAAQMLTDALEKYTNAIFIGEPTGSRGNAYGDSRRIILPNSGITVRVAIYYWQDWLPTDARDATMPAIAAPLTFPGYRREDDPALDAIHQYNSDLNTH